MKYFFNIFSLILMLTFVTCGSDDRTSCPDKMCSDYTSQADAQRAFDADPDCLGELDHDNDGLACEHILTGGGGGTSGCPTTANCGCSNKTMAECSGPCCRWIVGTGCRCS